MIKWCVAFQFAYINFRILFKLFLKAVTVFVRMKEKDLKSLKVYEKKCANISDFKKIMYVSSFPLVLL